jgi:monofunctional biosynthetic peptidoglycan transglycosylase
LDPQQAPLEPAGATAEPLPVPAQLEAVPASAGTAPAASPGAAAEPPAAPRKRRRIRRFLLWALVAYLAWEAVTWPNVGKLAGQPPETTAFISRYERRARWRDLPDVQWKWAPMTRISRHLGHAVAAAEDMEFFSHNGFSTHELENALRDAWEERRLPRGASTISQQLAKNLWLSPSYNPLRKVKEAILTWQLERQLSKRRILELYLNVVEFGPGVYGAEAASRHYYGKSARSLSRRQAASLAAGLSRPSSWHPGVTSRGYRRRVSTIEARMRQSAWIAREL